MCRSSRCVDHCGTERICTVIRPYRRTLLGVTPLSSSTDRAIPLRSSARMANPVGGKEDDVADQDRQRFTATFHACAPRIRAYARRHTEAHDCDDVVAEVFAIAWRRRAAIPPDPLPWLLVVARNVLANRRRTAARADRLWFAALVSSGIPRPRRRTTWLTENSCSTASPDAPASSGRPCSSSPGTGWITPTPQPSPAARSGCSRSACRGPGPVSTPHYTLRRPAPARWNTPPDQGQ